MTKKNPRIRKNSQSNVSFFINVRPIVILQVLFWDKPKSDGFGYGEGSSNFLPNFLPKSSMSGPLLSFLELP